MTPFYYEKDADPTALAGQTVAVVGYGNQGRPWALNLRDSGLNPWVCVRNDETRAQAEDDGFATGNISDAQEADIVCVLVPDDVIPQLGLERAAHQLTIIASAYCYAFKRFSPASQYGQLSRRGRFDALDLSSVMKDITRYIDSGAFADEWDAEAARGYPTLAALQELHAGEGVRAMEHDLMSRPGPGVKAQH